MTKTVKGAGRGKYAANRARHDQRTPLPARGSEPIHDRYTEILKEAVARSVKVGYSQPDEATAATDHEE